MVAIDQISYINVMELWDKQKSILLGVVIINVYSVHSYSSLCKANGH